MPEVYLTAAAKARIQKTGRISFKTLRGGFLRCNQDLEGAMPKIRPRQVASLVNQAFPRNNFILGIEKEAGLLHATQHWRGGSVSCPYCRRTHYNAKIDSTITCQNRQCKKKFIVDSYYK